MLASTRDVDLSAASPPWPSSEEVVGGWQVGSGNTEYGVLFRVQYRVVDDVVSDAGQNPLHESENARVSAVVSQTALERSHEPSENKRLHRFREEISAIVRGGHSMNADDALLHELSRVVILNGDVP